MVLYNRLNKTKNMQQQLSYNIRESVIPNSRSMIKNTLLFLMFLFLLTPTSTNRSTPTATPALKIVVNTTDDTEDDYDGLCSLREAINAATDRPGPDTITFDPMVFPLSGTGVIMPTLCLPALEDGGTTIDANGANVTINGSKLKMKEGLHIISSGNTVKGIRIIGFSSVGINIYADNNTLIDVTVAKNGYGVPWRADGIEIIGDSGMGCSASRNKIINCTIEDNADDGISVDARDGATVDYNIFMGNIVSGNGEVGIELNAMGEGSSVSHNIVRNNRVEENQDGGIWIEGEDGGRADNNTISSNIVTARTHELDGLSLMAWGGGTATDNVIFNNTIESCYGLNIQNTIFNTLVYHNNFINNRHNITVAGEPFFVQAEDHGSNSRWDHDGEGNYWSDYTGVDEDSDGIGDTPYYIPQNGVDHSPFMKPYGWVLRIAIIGPLNGSYLRGKTDVDVVGSDVNLEKTELYMNDTHVATWNVSGKHVHSWDTTVYADGTHIIRSKIYDKAMNTREARVTVIIDNTPPTLEVTQPAQGATIKNNTTTVTCDVNDATSGITKIEISVDDDPWIDVTNKTSHNLKYLTEGGHTIKVRAIDKAGNMEEASANFTVRAPRSAEFKVSSLSISPREVKPGDVVTIAVNITNMCELEGTYNVSLKIDGRVEATKDVTLAGGASKTVTFTATKNVAGTYYVEVDGQTGTIRVIEVTSPIEAWLSYGGIAIVALSIAAIAVLIIKRRR